MPAGISAGYEAYSQPTAQRMAVEKVREPRPHQAWVFPLPFTVGLQPQRQAAIFFGSFIILSHERIIILKFGMLEEPDLVEL